MQFHDIRPSLTSCPQLRPVGRWREGPGHCCNWRSWWRGRCAAARYAEKGNICGGYPAAQREQGWVHVLCHALAKKKKTIPRGCSRQNKQQGVMFTFGRDNVFLEWNLNLNLGQHWQHKSKSKYKSKLCSRYSCLLFGWVSELCLSTLRLGWSGLENMMV